MLDRVLAVRLPHNPALPIRGGEAHPGRRRNQTGQIGMGEKQRTDCGDRENNGELGTGIFGGRNTGGAWRRGAPAGEASGEAGGMNPSRLSCAGWKREGTHGREDRAIR
jgi:hypothetical protein